MFAKLGKKSIHYALLGGFLLSILMCSFVILFQVLSGALFGSSLSDENSHPSSEHSNSSIPSVTPTDHFFNPTPEYVYPTNSDTNPANQDVYPAQSYVIVNEARLSDETLYLLAANYGITVSDGEYWYDPYSGAWGIKGGPMSGFILANLNIGGPLRSDASGGGTSIFINGRELHPMDIYYLESILGSIPYGSYWLDAYGNLQYEGYSTSINIFQLASTAPVGPSEYGSNPYYHNKYMGTYFGSNGDEYYYYDSESGCSVMPDGVIC